MNILADRLLKKFGQRVLLNQISFSLKEAECLLVTGRNGSGKTTLLRCLAGSLLLDGGQLLVNGSEYDCRSHLKFLSYFNCEEGSYLPHLSFEQNLRFYLALRGLSSGDADNGLKFTEQFLPWRGFSKSGMDSLSRGGQQLFFLMRSLSDGNAQVFLLDEPFTHLDRERADGLRAVLKELLRQKKSVILTLQENQVELIRSIPSHTIALENTLI